MNGPIGGDEQVPPGREVVLPGTLRAQTVGSVAVLTLARPGKRNALSDETILGIERFFLGLDPRVHAVVIDADGDHFCAGLDLSELGERDTLAGIAHSRMWHRVFDLIENGSVPVIAALKGAVIGGGLELAAAAHIRVAERSAFYALPETSRGIFVGGGG
jgi:enoyl-CoA hydratase/carnithine racemase